MQLELFYKEEERNDGSTISHKTCYVCEEYKPWTIDYFGIASSCASGKVHLKGICKKCDNIASGQRKRLRKKHLKDRPSTCECCDRPAEYSSVGLHLDHCYKTGAFRGWLCPQCNRGIGNLGESIEGLEKAIAYLRNHDER